MQDRFHAAPRKPRGAAWIAVADRATRLGRLLDGLFGSLLVDE